MNWNTNVFGTFSWAYVRWAATMIIFGSVVFFTYRDDILGPLLGGITSQTAHIVFLVLHALEPTVVQEGAVIYQPNGFAYEIYFSCTGILPVSFIGVSMLTYPATWKHKLLGLVISIPLLMTINFTRLIHLFWVGIHNPDTFEFIHHVLWEGLIVLAAIVIWLVWLKGSHAPHVAKVRLCDLTV